MKNKILKDNLIIREEEDFIYIFDPVLSSVTKLNKNLFEKIEKKEELSENITELLSKQNLLNSKNVTTPPLNKLSLSGTKNLSDLLEVKNVKAPFNLIWAISPVCNLRCIYCFPNAKEVSKVMSFLNMDEIKIIIKALVKAKVFSVVITGGEPLLYPKIWEVISMLHQNNISVGIVTNGTIINEDILNKIKTNYNYLGISVSLDSVVPKINEITRGKNTTHKTIETIKLLQTVTSILSVSITLTQYNYYSLVETISYLKRMGIKHINIADLKPFGEKKDYEKYKLNNSQTENLKEYLLKLVNDNRDILINLEENLMFEMMKKNDSMKIMQCPAGETVGYIDFEGILYPCTQLSMLGLGKIENENSILDLWKSSKNIKKLRNLKNQSINLIEYCDSCDRTKFCDGGCRGEAFIYSKDWYSSSSNCPKNIK